MTARLSEAARAALAPVVPALRDFYEERGRRMTQRELWIEIERLFGNQLIQILCIPFGLSEGACLYAAELAAKGY